MPILIAMNPYKSLDIYNDKKIKFYKDFFYKLKTNPYGVNNPVPHLYHIAEAAYQDMINEKKNQSIIISGESGSGKTQSTKIILKYLAVSSLHSFDSIKFSNEKDEDLSVEKQVLDSNPLLEAFGNAKTVKNNNSSRFGKFIQLNFTENGKIISARIYNYLLEKSRVVNISPEERNYHIFYQLIRGADERERKKYNIKDIKYFKYLKSGCFDVDDIDDSKDFKETKDCMLKLKFKPEEISYIFTVMMGILYLGNVDLMEGEPDKMNNIPILINPETQSDFQKAAEMLGVEANTLLEILTIKKFKDISTGKFLNRKMTLDKSYHSRDSIAKIIYSKVFDYILKKINFAISNSEEIKNRKNLLKIGLLDIFGFENFQLNSFEQLCINYANERLQQFFNNHIFKLEQEEYSKEGIDFNQVEFKDNNEIINLIDDPKNSIFSFLDSEALLANGSDENFHKKIYKSLSDHESLLEKIEEYIGIEHYAGEVYYYIDGFMRKNIDQLNQDIMEALEKSKNRLIKKIFEKKSETVKKNSLSSSNINLNSKIQSDSISKQFKTQLDELMKMLSQSNPRYIKCIKPNSQKKPIEIESLDVMDQLLSAGVLEAIKIRKQGYPIRRTNEEFSKRYLKLFPDIRNKMKIYEEKNNFAEPAKLMFDFFSNLEDMKEFFNPNKKLIQSGYTKIFMKEEVKNVLEFKLNKIKYIQIMQNNVRGFNVRKIVKKKLKSIRKIQALFRGFVARI
jgi:myosin heavy subunit